jgi:IS30 family transposase
VRFFATAGALNFGQPRQIKQHGIAPFGRRHASWLITHLPFLSRAVSAKLRRKWSPEQIAVWLKRCFPEEAHKQVSHETIYRSLYMINQAGLSPNHSDYN